MKIENRNTDITRKEAIKKMGKYAAFTAVGTFAILSPLRANDTSTPPNPFGNDNTTNGTNNEGGGTVNAEETLNGSEFTGSTSVENNFPTK